MIIMWSGSQASIPSGWLLCNGLNGTPNLIDRFIIGAGNNYAVGATGGSKDATLVSHTHTATSTAAGAHSHNYTRTDYSTSATDYQFAGSYSLSQTTQATSAVGDHNHTISIDTVGSSATNANLPPYYALCFIMKA
jgi:microcystin-dependent protein